MKDKLNLYHYNKGEDILSGKSNEDKFNHVASFIRNWLKIENLNVFIGSGCSTPAISLMNQTFQATLDANKDIYNEDTYKVYENKHDEIKKEINIEEYLDWLIQAINFYDITDNSKKNQYVNAFETTIKGILDSMPNEYSGTSEIDEVLETYRKFYEVIFNNRVNSKGESVNVFTSNYDLFNEIALETNNIDYTTGFKGNVERYFTPSVFRFRIVDDENRYKDKWDPIRRYVKLYKIHGSVNWLEDEEANKIIQKDFYSSNNEIEARMIYPAMSKHNLTRQSPYSELFREFSIHLQTSKSVLIIIGYGFPDTHINQLISQGLDNPDLTVIIFGNKNEDNLKEFIKSSKKTSNLHIIGGIDENDNVIGHYFNNVVSYLGGL